MSRLLLAAFPVFIFDNLRFILLLVIPIRPECAATDDAEVEWTEGDAKFPLRSLVVVLVVDPDESIWLVFGGGRALVEGMPILIQHPAPSPSQILSQISSSTPTQTPQ